MSLNIYIISYTDTTKPLAHPKRHGKSLIRAKNKEHSKKNFNRIYINRSIYGVERVPKGKERDYRF